ASRRRRSRRRARRPRARAPAGRSAWSDVRSLFFGTPELSVPSLEALASISTIVGVVCQPDKPVGRGMKLATPPVKERALAMGLPVVQPLKLRTGEFAQ